MRCEFCQIIERKKPADIFYENEHIIAFADIIPRAAVHLLVCPKTHFSTIIELPDELSIKLLEAVRLISHQMGIEDNFRLILNNGAKAGQIIEHLHFHFLSNARIEKIEYKF